MRQQRIVGHRSMGVVRLALFVAYILILSEHDILIQ